MKKQITNKIGPAGHRQRLKERFLKAGRKALADYELIELLLTYSISRVDTKPLQKMLDPDEPYTAVARECLNASGYRWAQRIAAPQ